MKRRLETYKFILIFCLVIIAIVVGSSINKVRRHKTELFDKNHMSTTVNSDDTSGVTNDNEYFDLESSTPEQTFKYDGYFDTHERIDRWEGSDLADDEEYVSEMLNTEPITENDFKDIIVAVQATDNSRTYEGYRITDKFREEIQSGKNRVSGYDGITANYITIDALGVADDGEYVGRVTFKVPTEQTFNIEGFIVNGQVDSMQIF